MDWYEWEVRPRKGFLFSTWVSVRMKIGAKSDVQIWLICEDEVEDHPGETPCTSTARPPQITEARHFFARGRGSIVKVIFFFFFFFFLLNNNTIPRKPPPGYPSHSGPRKFTHLGQAIDTFGNTLPSKKAHITVGFITWREGEESNLSVRVVKVSPLALHGASPSLRPTSRSEWNQPDLPRGLDWLPSPLPAHAS